MSEEDHLSQQNAGYDDDDKIALQTILFVCGFAIIVALFMVFIIAAAAAFVMFLKGEDWHHTAAISFGAFLFMSTIASIFLGPLMEEM